MKLDNSDKRATISGAGLHTSRLAAEKTMMTVDVWRSLMVCCAVGFAGAFVSNVSPKLGQLALLRTLQSLRSALQFLRLEHKHLNLDGVIGPRVVEGQLHVLLLRITTNPQEWNVDEDVLTELLSLKKLAGDLSDAALPYVEKSDPPYFEKTGQILQEGFWEFYVPSRNFSMSELVWPVVEHETMTEEQSDNCLGELLGSGKHKAPCTISRECWTMMTTPGFYGYSLTHQIFYQLIGKQAGCSEELEKSRRHDQPSLQEMIATFCANMLEEAMVIADNGFQGYYTDLFMEQTCFAGLYGYRQFFTYEWLNEILSWQDQNLGCYKNPPRDESYKTLLHRTKREERPLRDGCMAHRTSVAVGALVTYIRYILEWQQQNAR